MYMLTDVCQLKVWRFTSQEVAQSYVRNHRVPPTYGLSTCTSSLTRDYLYEYEEMSTEITPNPSCGSPSFNGEPA